MTEAQSGRPKPEKELRAYKNGDTIRLPIQFRDETGVADAYANFIRYSDPDRDAWDTDNQIHLQGSGGGKTTVTVMLTAQLANQRPGIYGCYSLTARDNLGNRREEQKPQRVPRFRVEHGPGDREGPEVVDIGEFQQ